jgi:hypothetical protein
MSAQKRLRERKKAELKREMRRQAAQTEREPASQVAGRQDLEDYGVVASRDRRGER